LTDTRLSDFFQENLDKPASEAVFTRQYPDQHSATQPQPVQQAADQRQVLIIPPYTVVWGILSLLCVCLFVFCTATDFSAAEKGAGVTLCVLVRPNRFSPILVNFSSRGVTAAAWDELYRNRSGAVGIGNGAVA